MKNNVEDINFLYEDLHSFHHTGRNGSEVYLVSVKSYRENHSVERN
jgi:hypothetical protein